MNSTFTVSQSLNWFDNATIIVRMYFLNNVPFTFDEMPEGHLYDRDLVNEADKNRDYDLEDVFQGSTYLALEGCHPCFHPIEISNRDELPEDLIPFYDEEDLGR